MSSRKPNRWKGFVAGALGGVAGALAMRYYWQRVTELAGQDPRKMSREGNPPQPLDDISLVGKQHQPGESTTAALGRIVYERITGGPPQSEETKTVLSYGIHYLISMLASGMYGLIQARGPLLDIQGGFMLGAGLWLFGDELAMPLLGLAEGPTAYPEELHAYSFGAHLAYGLGSSITTQLLYRLLP